MTTMRVNSALDPVIQTANRLTDKQKETLKPAIDLLLEMEKAGEPTADLRRFASSILVVGKSLMTYCEVLGPPNQTRNRGWAEHGHAMLAKAGITTVEAPAPKPKEKPAPRPATPKTRTRKKTRPRS